MSSHGRRRQSPPPAGPAQLGWALLVIAAALIGGLAAATLVHASVAVAVIASVVVGAVAVLAVFRSPARPPELGSEPGPGDDAVEHTATRPRHVPAGPAPASPAPASPAPAGPAPASPAPAGPVPPAAAQLLPLPGSPAPPDTPWWDSAQGAPAPSPGARRVPAPDLSTYLASTFIAQCPRCGAFRLDLRRSGTGWDFRCESCEYTWTWQPGTPWPPVRVMPRGRRE